MPTTASNVTLKLLIDRKTKRVLFAEAGKEFVDFLFTLLSLPLGTVIKLLSENKMVGCLGNLYQSIAELSDIFIQPSQSKDSVLNPKVLSSTTDANLLLAGCDNNSETSATRKVYMCYYCDEYVGDNPETMCPNCNGRRHTEVQFVATAANAGNNGGGNQNNEGGGFVKGVVTYMVMDNLEVKPMSTISSIALLNKFNIQQVGALEEKVITVGMDEGLKLLKASLQSKTVLTSVFLGA
ncbi:hypothetical protein LINGRAHAP2_LOCUS19450 [Linum grandiflorum]